MIRRRLGWFAGALGALSAACGSSSHGGSSGGGSGLASDDRVVAYCDQKGQCSGGNEKDVSACKAEIGGAGEVAAAYGCADPFSKVVDCYKAKSQCKGGAYASDCGSEIAALAACEKAASCRGTTSGCTPSGSAPHGDDGAYCFAQAQCLGGNDKDVAGCMAELGGARDVAGAYGCSSAFDAVLSCYGTSAKCQGGAFAPSCGSEESALGACEKGASAKK